MAKSISQDTFNSVVKENMEEFDMDAEEAVADAVEQFNAQHVDLSHIVRDLSLYGGGDGSETTHPLLASIEKLKELTESENPDVDLLKDACKTLCSECDKDLAHRMMAANNNSYPIIISAIEKFQRDNVLLEPCVTVLLSLINGHPDLVTENNMDLLLNLVKDKKDSSSLCPSLVKIIRLSCLKHEQNRQSFVQNNLIPVLMEALLANREVAEVIKEVCMGLRVLTFDDDVRAPFGKAHDHAKLIVEEENAIKILLDICKEYSDNVQVLFELYGTLSCLTVRSEFCQQVLDLGGLKLMLDTMEKHLDYQALAKQVLSLLKAIAGNDDVKVAIVKAGGVEHILAVMTKHQKISSVCNNGCAALGAVALRNPDHCTKMVEMGSAVTITTAMKLHPQFQNVQKEACCAIRNIVSRNRNLCQAFLDQDAEQLVQEAMKSYPDCKDVCKAALRDLGCNVELVERWTGTKEGIKY